MRIPSKIPKNNSRGIIFVMLSCQKVMCNGCGRFGGQIAGGYPKAFPQPRQPLFALPTLRELESACRVSIL